MYQHNVKISYSSGNITTIINLTIINDSNTQFNESGLAQYLQDNGITNAGTNSSIWYDCSGYNENSSQGTYIDIKGLFYNTSNSYITYRGRKNDGTITSANISGYTYSDSVEEIGQANEIDGSVVVANPTLAGTESELSGLEVDGTKYKVGGGGSQLYQHNITSEFTNVSDRYFLSLQIFTCFI